MEYKACGNCMFFDGIYCIEGNFRLHRNKTDMACTYFKEA